MKAVQEGNEQVIQDVKRIAKYSDEGALPKTPQELCNQVFTTIYMGMKKQSSRETRQRARDLSEAIGSYHVNLDIDDVYEAQKKLVMSTMNFEPKFKVEGGTNQENLTLQCLQARIRMVTAYVSKPQRGCIYPVGNRSGRNLDKFFRQPATVPVVEVCWCWEAPMLERSVFRGIPSNGRADDSLEYVNAEMIVAV